MKTVLVTKLKRSLSLGK